MRTLRELRPGVMGLVVLACGATIGVRVDVVGEVYLVELLLPVLALFAVLSRGMGASFHGGTMAWTLGAGAVTFTGYLLSDLAAANEPWQYLRGWGRVLLLLTDCAALIVLVAHGRRNLWWFLLGLALGGAGWLLATGVPLTRWKIGYGEYAAFLLAVTAGLLPRYAGVLLLGGCGVFSLMLDYRSLGAASLVSAMLLTYPAQHALAARARRIMLTAVAGACVVTLLSMALNGTEEEYADRRRQSNSGRMVGLKVAWHAIAESPFIGYGSWAAEGKFAQMLRDESYRLERELGRPVGVGRSLLPHSQVLQAWVEGGILGAGFFLIYGVALLGALHWFAFRRSIDWLTASGTFALVYALWNYIASPFLGFTRVYIAVAVGLIAISQWERAQGRRRAVIRSAMPEPNKMPLAGTGTGKFASR